jgi:hypothetical protein
MAITPARERVRKSRERKRHPIKDDDIPTHELLHRHFGAVTSSHRIWATDRYCTAQHPLFPRKDGSPHAISGRSLRARTPFRVGLKHLDANLGHTTIRNPQVARGAEREVEDAVANPWSAVGDHNYYGSVGRKISHANSRAERQAAVGCGRQISIERCTARCFSCLIRIV